MENKKITIQDIVDEVAAKGGFTKKYTEDFLRELVSVIEEYLNRDGLVKVKGLGTFKLLWNEERKSVNVMTQEEIVIPAHYKVSFTPETSVKERINEPYSHLSTMVHGTSDSASQPASEPQPAPVSAPECGYMMPASELRSDLPEPQEEQPAPTATPASDPEPAPSAWSWSRVETPSAPTSEPEPEPAPQTYTPEPESAYMMPADELRSEEPEVPAEPAPEKKKSKGWLVFLIILLVLALLGAAAYFLRGYWWDKAEPYVKPVVNEYCPEWMIPSSLKAVTDTVAALPVADESLEAVADSAVVDEVVEIEEAEPNEEEENAQYLEQDRQMLLDGYTPAYAQQVPVRETVTIINGSRLTMVSLRAFGHKDFWVYIYDANRDQLSSPGAVKPGMTLRIPDMDPLIVDPNNEECLHKAQELARKY